MPICDSNSEVSTFSITVEKGEGKVLGLTPPTGPDWHIEKIIPDTLLATWNAASVGSEVQVGDRIVEVNGVSGDPLQMLDQCKRTGTLHIKFRREVEGDEVCRADSPMSATAFWNGLSTVHETFDMEVPASLAHFEEQLIKHHEVKNPTRRERLAKEFPPPRGRGHFVFFTVQGDRAPVQVTSPAGLAGLVLAFEGGSFVWPGVEVGFVRNVSVTPKNEEPLPLQLHTRSLQPLVIEVSSFIGADLCQHVIKKASPKIAKSDVSHMDHDRGKAAAEWRTSSTYFMASDDDELRALDRRVSALTLTAAGQQEHLQVLRYEETERYVAHHDYFDINMYKKDKGIQQMTKNGLYNRLLTTFFYLTTVEEGGQTNFPRAGGGPQPRDFGDCSKGVSVYPQEGRIVLFYSQDTAGRTDPYSMHGGCSVVKGTKWSANKWVWNQPRMGFTPD